MSLRLTMNPPSYNQIVAKVLGINHCKLTTKKFMIQDYIIIIIQILSVALSVQFVQCLTLSPHYHKW